MKYFARKRCTRPCQLTIFDKSHSGWLGAHRPVLTEITLGVSSNSVKDEGLATGKGMAPGRDRLRRWNGYPSSHSALNGTTMLSFDGCLVWT
jgi:hypothetical protein